jgi:hypothetical protein
MRLALCALVALAACGGTPDPNDPQAACRAEAEQTNAVRELSRSRPSINNPTIYQAWEERVTAARQTAVQNCLADRGLATRAGFGVEPVLRR